MKKLSDHASFISHINLEEEELINKHNAEYMISGNEEIENLNDRHMNKRMSEKG